MSEFGARRRRPTRKRRRGVAVATRRFTAKRRRLNSRTSGFLGIEKKFADFQTDNDAFATTWTPMEDATILSVSGVSQGNSESQRLGRKMTILSVHIKAVVKMVNVEANVNVKTDLRGRIALVLDTQTNAAQLTATDVYDDGQTDDILAFRDLQFTSRYKVLWDKPWVLKPQQMAQGAVDLFAHSDTHTHVMRFNKVFKTPLQVTYNSTTTNVIAAITDNSLHIIGIANNTAALLSYQFRMRFTG